MNCSICQNPIPVKDGWEFGNNASPVNDGRCCDECNDQKVTPARLDQSSKIPSEEWKLGPRIIEINNDVKFIKEFLLKKNN